MIPHDRVTPTGRAGTEHGSGNPENDYTNRNATFMTWNLLRTGWAGRVAGSRLPVTRSRTCCEHGTVTTTRQSWLPGLAAWSDQASFVGEDDGLDPVPQSQLGQQAVHVRLDRSFRQVQAGGDLGVGQALGDE